jgi:hypothetical protein
MENPGMEEPEPEDLWEKMMECAKADSWESMTLDELIRLEALGRAEGQKDLWFRIGTEKKGEKSTLRAEIKRRQELHRIARLAMRGEGPPPMLPD